MAVIVVQANRTLLIRVHGVRNVATGAPMTPQTPIYTGSTTKSYTGLLAAELDRKGLLTLGTSLADIWPGLILPAPLDPSHITAAHLLSHSADISDSGLVFQSNDSGEYSLDEVPQHLARFAVPLGAPFRYSNFGPFLYSMMAEKRLGRGWRELMEEHVLRPLGLRRTSARLEDFRPDEPSRCHSRIEPGAGWETIEPKPTPLLNAAGGLYASIEDAGRFLRAFTSRGGSARERIPASSLARTAQIFSNQDAQTWGFHRRHYGLGWDISTYGNRTVLLRAGVYPGCRAMYVIDPEAQLAIAVLTASDIAGHGYNAAIVQQAIDLWSGSPDAGASAERRITEFSRDAAAAVARAQRARAVMVAPARVGDLRVYEGRYANERLGVFTISVQGAGLRARMGLFSLLLTPVAPDRFEGIDALNQQSTTFAFRRGNGGRPTELLWGDREFQRVGD